MLLGLLWTLMGCGTDVAAETCDPVIEEAAGVCFDGQRADELRSETWERLQSTEEDALARDAVELEAVDVSEGNLCCDSCYSCCRRDCGDNGGTIGTPWECVWICM